jgi:hypothetical protein
MRANASRQTEYEPSPARRSSSTSRQTTRYACLATRITRSPHRALPRPPHPPTSSTRFTLLARTQILMTVIIGFADKGARRRKGGHPTCTAALDLRRKANVRVYLGWVCRMQNANTGVQGGRQDGTGLSAGRRCYAAFGTCAAWWMLNGSS